MKKIKSTKIILITLAILVFIFLLYFAWTIEWHPGPDSMQYKSIEGTQVVAKCLEYKDDTCGLFDCMVDRCWCDDSSPDLPILYETQTIITDEQGAIDVVNSYIAKLKYGELETDIKNPKILEVTWAVQLNNIFYNVFVEDGEGSETIFTVAIDGTIMKTICGV